MKFGTGLTSKCKTRILPKYGSPQQMADVMAEQLGKQPMESQVRIYMWVASKTGSSAFSRAFMSRKDTKVLFEPLFRTKFDQDEQDKKLAERKMTEAEVKALCEFPYSEYRCVFAKDMARFVMDKQGKLLCDLPERFKHVILIRSPEKSLQSLYRQFLRAKKQWYSSIIDFTQSINQLQLYKYLQKNNEDPVVIDFDDVIENPEKLVQAFCEKVGLNYDSCMVNWNPVTEEQWKDPVLANWGSWLEDSMHSPGFHSAKIYQSLDLPPEVINSITENMPFYEELYRERLQFLKT